MFMPPLSIVRRDSHPARRFQTLEPPAVIDKLCAVPPTPPTLLATGTTIDAVQLQWKQGDNGGAPIKGFLLAYRREFSEWEEVMLDRKANTHLLEGLQCGTRYQFTLAAFNRIGSGSASKIESAKTNGTKPLPPSKHQLVKVNQTLVNLELASWQDGGCPLMYFVVEYRRLPGDWLLGKYSIIYYFILYDGESRSNILGTLNTYFSRVEHLSSRGYKREES